MISDLSKEINIYYEKSQFTTDQETRIIVIEAITGLINLKLAFIESDHMSEIEAIIIFLNKKYDFRLYEDPYYFIKEIARFSDRALNSVNANYNEFFYNMTIEEALIIVLSKLLNNDNTPSLNGFPVLEGANSNIVGELQSYRGISLLFQPRNMFNSIDISEMLNLQLNPSGQNQLFYHGTSWKSAKSIMARARVTQRGQTSDFGLRNFYLTDTLKTSYIWATHNVKPAIVVFSIPYEYIMSLDEKHLELQNDETWQQMIYKVRNPNIPENDFDGLYEDQYNNFISELDSNCLISGPICKNPMATNFRAIKAIKYGNYVPLQYSFKDSTINDINNMKIAVIELSDIDL